MNKTKRMKIALRVIEGLCLLEEKEEDVPFYEAAHWALGHCKNPHEYWEKKVLDIHNKLIENKIIGPEEE